MRPFEGDDTGQVDLQLSLVRFMSDLSHLGRRSCEVETDAGGGRRYRSGGESAVEMDSNEQEKVVVM